MKKNRFKKPKRTVRVNWTININALNMLEAAAKHNGNSISKIVSELVLQKLSDPIKRLHDEIREQAQQINIKQKRLEELKEAKTNYKELR